MDTPNVELGRFLQLVPESAELCGLVAVRASGEHVGFELRGEHDEVMLPDLGLGMVRLSSESSWPSWQTLRSEGIRECRIVSPIHWATA